MTLELYKIVESNGNYLKVNIPTKNISLLNELRKIILSHIPSMSITLVVVNENNSSLYDEILSHRLAMLSLFSSETDYTQYRDGDNYDERNSIKFSIDVIYSPKKNYVMSNDLIWVPQGKQSKYITLKPRVISENVLICKLAYNQRIQLEAYATKGIGSINAKFNVVSTCYYKEEKTGGFNFILQAENGIDPELILKKGIAILNNKKAYSYMCNLLGKKEGQDEEENI